MRKRVETRIDAPPASIASVLRDLGRYPDWLDIVTAAIPTTAAADDPGPAWLVTLRAKIGPLARSKRLRMVRVVDETNQLRFERREVDGRDHAEWTLDATIEGMSPCRVEVTLAYAGNLWSRPLEAVLSSQIDDAIPKLRDLVIG
ncbi:MAG: SRPBCC family protein [Acidimicrobiales bacterium]